MKMKNKLTDLNNHLFEQLERLNDDDLKGEELEEEISRTRAISSIATKIIDNGQLILNAQKVQQEYGRSTFIPLPLLGQDEKKK